MGSRALADGHHVWTDWVYWKGWDEPRNAHDGDLWDHPRHGVRVKVDGVWVPVPETSQSGTASR